MLGFNENGGDDMINLGLLGVFWVSLSIMGCLRTFGWYLEYSKGNGS